MTRGDWLPGQAGHAAEHNDIDRRFREMPSVSDFGAKGDNQADDTSALQTAINTVGAGGDTLYMPRGIFKTTAPLNLGGSGVRLIGASRSRTRIRNPVSDVFTGNATNYEIAHIDISASAGHIFAQNNMASCYLHDLNLSVSNTNKSICYMDNSLTGNAIQNVVERCNMTLTANHAAPGWYHKSSGTCNLNVWRDCMCVRSGNYFFHIENVNIQNWAYDNRFENMCFELCDGGSIKLLSCRDALIENCHEYDVSGQYQKDLYFIGKHATGQPSWECSLRHCGRRGGSLAAGVYDVNIDDGRSIVLDTVSPSALASFAMRKGNNSTVLILNEQARGIQVGMFSPDGTLWKQVVNDLGAVTMVRGQ